MYGTQYSFGQFYKCSNRNTISLSLNPSDLAHALVPFFHQQTAADLLSEEFIQMLKETNAGEALPNFNVGIWECEQLNLVKIAA